MIPYIFKDFFSVFLKNVFGILIWVAVNPQMALETMDILTILIFPIHEYQLSFCLCHLQFLTSQLQFSGKINFSSLAICIPKYFILLFGIMNRIVLFFRCFIVSVQKHNYFLYVDFVSCNFTEFINQFQQFQDYVFRISYIDIRSYHLEAKSILLLTFLFGGVCFFLA